jgi:hypothetical protein
MILDVIPEEFLILGYNARGLLYSAIQFHKTSISWNIMPEDFDIPGYNARRLQYPGI